MVSNRSLGVNQTVLNQLELALPWVVLFFCKCTGVFTLFVLFQLWSHTWSEDWRIFTICVHWVWECKCLLPLDDFSMVIKNLMSNSALAYLRLLFRNFDPYVCQDMINNNILQSCYITSPRTLKTFDNFFYQLRVTFLRWKICLVLIPVFWIILWNCKKMWFANHF